MFKSNIPIFVAKRVMHLPPAILLFCWNGIVDPALRANDTNGGLIYAANDIVMAGSLDQNGQAQGELGNLLSASSKIEVGRHISMAVAVC